MLARPKLPPDEIRLRRDIWLSAPEWAEVCEAAAAAALPVRKYCRRVLLRRKITPAPSLENRAAWVELARVHANLNQIAHALNVAAKAGATDAPNVSDLVELLRRCDEQTAALRAELMGDGDDR